MIVWVALQCIRGWKVHLGGIASNSIRLRMEKEEAKRLINDIIERADMGQYTLTDGRIYKEITINPREIQSVKIEI